MASRDQYDKDILKVLFIIINFCIQERYFRRIYGRGGER